MGYYHNLNNIDEIWRKKRIKSKVEIQHLKDRMRVVGNPFFYFYAFVKNRKPVLYDDEVIDFKVIEPANTSVPVQTGVKGYWCRVVICWQNRLNEWEEDSEVLLVKLTKKQYDAIRQLSAGDRFEVSVEPYEFKEYKLRRINIIKFK